nr:acyltransferase family protein [uncultured Cohaesibacter sp.]
MKMNYRADIDGLRALAVTVVVLFHLNPRLSPGGFVGVDVFFVISGFLITQIIHREIEEKSFSLWNFYARRFRRILPALLSVCVAVFIYSAFVDAPAVFSETALSIVAAAGFVANLHFKDHQGYFDPAAHEQPMLHTWSLGVEEQYYLIWPLLLMLLALPAFRKYRKQAVVFIILLSLGMSEYLTKSAPDVAYYMLHSRLWELAVGSLLALVNLKTDFIKKWAPIISAAGLALILYAVVFLDGSTPFPGIYAVPAVLGSALLLVGGGVGGGPASALFRLKPIVALGKASYSAYLWHWPILVLYIGGYGAPSAAAQAGLLAVILALSFFSLHFIERPFRYGSKTNQNSKAVVGVGLACVLFVASIGLYAHLSKGWRWRGDYTPFIARLEKQSKMAVYGSCEKSKDMVTSPNCILGDKEKANDPKLLLIGDSHAGHYGIFASKLAEAAHVGGRLLSQSACLPVAGADHFLKGEKRDCSTLLDDITRGLEAYPDIKLILVAGRWNVHSYEDPMPKEVNSRGVTLIAEPGIYSATKAQARKAIRVHLQQMIDYLKQHSKAQIVLLDQVPLHTSMGKKCVMQNIWAGRLADDCDIIPLSVIDKRLGFGKDLLKDMAKTNDRVDSVSFDPFFCEGGLCRIFTDHTMIYRDDDHLSIDGSAWLFKQAQEKSDIIDKLIEKMK